MTSSALHNTQPPIPDRPYPGLRSFYETESRVFFGRDRHTVRMLTTLVRQHFLAVVGTSGCGKSSLVKAGLLPELSSPETRIGDSERAWVHVVARPGGGPFRNLAAELVRQTTDAVDPLQVEQRLRSGPHGLMDAIYSVPGLASHNVLVVIDQFEEIFRFGDTSQRSLSELERTSLHDDALAFVATLLAAVEERNPQVYVALTMRSGSLGRCDMFEGLPEAITRSQFLPPRMTREQLLDAILEPLKLFGSTIEDAVISDLLEAMGDRQDQLPVIQHALAQLWHFASEGKQPGEPRRITTAHADRCRASIEQRTANRLGWVTDAISTHADAVYESLAASRAVGPPALSERQRIARAMFCSLSQVDNLDEPERRLSSLEEVAGIVFGEPVSPQQLQQVAEVAAAFGAEGHNFVFRSTTPDGRKVLDVSHESLLRHWPRLRQWLQVEAAAARRFEQLQQQVRDGVTTLDGVTLDLADRWRKSASPTVTWSRRFLPKSVAADRDESTLPRCLKLIEDSLAARKAEQQAKEQARREKEEAQSRELEATKKLAAAEGERAVLERKKAQAIRSWMVIVVCLAVGAGVLAVYAWHKSGEANASRISVRELAANSCLRNGTTAIRYEHNVAAGVNWFAEALQTIEDASPETRFAARSLIGEWGRSLPRFSLVHDGPVWKVSFSPDGCTLATTSEDATARLWDAETGQPRGDPLKHDAPVRAVSFSPDGRTLATASWDDTARLWDAETGQSRGVPFKHDGPVVAVSFSPDGRTLATASWDDTARLWDAETGQPRGEPLKHDGSVGAVSFSPDGRTLATASEDQTARLWDAETGQSRGVPFKHDGPVNAVSFSPDGRTLATASWDSTARLWDAATGEPRSEPLKHDDRVSAVSFSPDGRTLATASWDDTARLWDAATGDELRREEPLKHDGRVFALSFSPDGRTLATASRDGTARLWDVATGQARGDPVKHDVDVNAVSFSPDGRTLATASYDKTARLWDVPNGQPWGDPLKIAASAVAVSFSPDGRTLATASGDHDKNTGEARLWDAATGQPRGQPLKHDSAVNAVSFRPDGRMLATASGYIDKGTGEVQLWDAATGYPRGKPLHHERAVSAVSFSPDGRTLATASRDQMARLWDAATGQPRGEPLKHDGHVVTVSFSPDGRTLATASWDDTARLWDAKTGQPCGEPLKHDGWVFAVSFSPDGRTLATASEGKEARLWNAATGLPRCEPLKLEGEVRAVSFSPDGSKLATATVDSVATATVNSDHVPGSVQLWVVPPPVPDDPDWVRLAVEVATGKTIDNHLARPLKQAEWLERKKLLDTRGGDCLRRTWDDLTEAEKLELRTPAAVRSHAQ